MDLVVSNDEMATIDHDDDDNDDDNMIMIIMLVIVVVADSNHDDGGGEMVTFTHQIPLCPMVFHHILVIFLLIHPVGFLVCWGCHRGAG